MCCIKIIRDVELEEKENEFEITHNQSSFLNEKTNEEKSVAI
jgi:hypothetical protein